MRVSRRCRWAIIAVVFAGVAGTRAWAEATGCSLPLGAETDPLTPARTAVVSKVIDGDTLVVGDGEEIRLTGIQAPKLPLGRQTMTAWPLAAEAKSRLEGLVRGGKLRIYPLGRGTDRHGRTLAHLVTDEMPGTWLQGEMVRQGFARVYTFADNRSCAAELYARERAARAAGRGIWALRYYAIRDARGTLEKDLGTFQLVEGTVMRVAQGGRGIHLDFGADYHDDFSVFITPSSRRLFAREHVDLNGVLGRRLRVRGWLDKRNGPQIEVTHPEQIELLDGP